MTHHEQKITQIVIKRYNLNETLLAAQKVTYKQIYELDKLYEELGILQSQILLLQNLTVL